MELLVALRIKIGRKFEGRQMVNSYPAFNSLPANVRGDMDWSHYIDQFTCWHYDKKSGFGEQDDYNPSTQIQYGVFCVPPPFAEAALAAFPDTVEQLSEEEFVEFYDSRAHEHESEVRYDEGALNGLRARYGDLPIADAELIEFFTDATEDNEDAFSNHYKEKKGRSLTGKEKQHISTLVKMTPGDCKALNPNHPSPGVRKNKNRFYVDFKSRRGFTIRAK